MKVVVIGDRGGRATVAFLLGALLFGGYALAQNLISGGGGGGAAAVLAASASGTDLTLTDRLNVGPGGVRTDGGLTLTDGDGANPVRITAVSGEIRFPNDVNTSGGGTYKSTAVAANGIAYATNNGYYYTGAASGNKAFWAANDGARIYHGGTAYSSASGDTVTFTGALAATSTLTRGTITLSGGTGTATVNSGAKCVCGTETANAVRCSVSSTTLTCTGTNTDACNYHCF